MKTSTSTILAMLIVFFSLTFNNVVGDNRTVLVNYAKDVGFVYIPVPGMFSVLYYRLKFKVLMQVDNYVLNAMETGIT